MSIDWIFAPCVFFYSSTRRVIEEITWINEAPINATEAKCSATLLILMKMTSALLLGTWWYVLSMSNLGV